MAHHQNVERVPALPQDDLSQLSQLLEDVKQQALHYLELINDRPLSGELPAIQAEPLPAMGMGATGALHSFRTRLEPMLAATSGPRFWGYVTGGTTPAAIMGDWLTTVYDQNSFATTGQGDISGAIELETIQLMLDLFELPHDFLGGFVTGATMSNFTCLAVARQWAGRQMDMDIARQGMQGPLQILSAMPHSSSLKALSMLGQGSNHIIRVQVQEGNREAMDIADLEAQMATLEGSPFILVSSGGTVNTVDYDDCMAIAQLKTKYHFWWHIDAAFGGFAVLSPAHKHLLQGWEHADSITIDCHKWMNVPYESAVFFVKDKHRNLQVETFQNSNAPYLGDPLENFSYLNFLPENSRRLKALPAWFSLMAYGKKGFAEMVTGNIRVAQKFGELLEAAHLFTLLAHVRLNTVCFTLAGDENQDKVPDFLRQLNATGRVFMTPTVYQGKKGIRAAFVNWRTTVQDAEEVAALMEAIAGNIIG